MDYIGSKRKLNNWIFEKIQKNIKVIEKITFLDACAGSGSVTKEALQMGMKVISNDIMKFSSYIVKGNIKLEEKDERETNIHIENINNLKGIEGFFFNNYSENANRLYFTNENAKKIDECRNYIEKIKNEKIKNYLMYCAIEALSKVSNTTGVQAAFLKNFKERANVSFCVKKEKTIDTNTPTVFTSPIEQLLVDKIYRENYKENIIYIDPPYNSRQYGPNYHLYETFARYDNPEIKGKTGLRKNWQNESKSDFCKKSEFLNLLRKIYVNTTAEYIYMSYSSDGLLTIEEICSYLNSIGINEISIHQKITKRYKSDISEKRIYNNNCLNEYLIEVKKEISKLNIF